MTQLPRTESRTGHDRRQDRVYRFMDRRTGFDRRRSYPVLGTVRDNEWLLLAILITLNLLSLADGVLTAVELSLGIATEGNPILASLIEFHPLAAVAVKVGSILIVSAIIWHARKVRAVIAVSLASVAVFAALVAYHLGSLSGLGLI